MDSGALSASVLGNVLTVGIGIVVWLIKNKCKHCESECDMPCCRVSARDETTRGTSRPPDLSVSESTLPEVCDPTLESNPRGFLVVRPLD